MRHAKFGWKRDSGKQPRRLLGGIVDLNATPRGSADLRSHSPAVMDQNFCGSCCGQGTSAAITTAYAVAGTPLFGLDLKGHPVACSPRDIYAGGRCVARLDDTTPLSDDGTEVLCAVQYVAAWGSAPMTGVPMISTDPDTGESYEVNDDCVPANVNDEPTFGELEQESTHLIPMAHQIISTGTTRINDVCLSLDAGHPVVFGTYVDGHFLSYTGGIVGAQGSTGGGGHCMCLLGYETVASKRIFFGRNSWGESWGESGDFRCSEAFVMQIDELFAVTAGGAS